MRRVAASRLGLVLCGAGAILGCGPRLVGRVSRDGAAPIVEAGAEIGLDVVDAGFDVAVDIGSDIGADVGFDVGGGADAAVDVFADLRADVPPEGPPPPPPGLPQVCTVDGWCWTHPLPTGDRFVDAFKVGADDLWLAGAAGTIVRFSGGKLSVIPPPTSVLAAIWASAPNDVWAGGPAGPYHWDGQAWSQIGITASPTSRGVEAMWGCAPADVWAVGPIASRWDGKDWRFTPLPSDVLLNAGGFRAVWGSACNDVWAGSLLESSGTGGIYHFDGSAWARVESRPAEQMAGIARSDVWSLAQGRLFRAAGVAPGTFVTDHVASLCPVGADRVGVMNDAHAVSLIASGGATTSIPAPAPEATSTLRGWAPDDLWALGAVGTAARWNGETWERHLPAWLLSGEDATRVTGGGPGDLWAVVGGALLRGDGTSWQIARTADQFGGGIVDLWAAGSNEVWVLGGDNLVHRFQGGGWTTDNPLPVGSATPRMRAISGTGPNDVWILRGTNTLLHWDGGGWIGRDATVYAGGAVNAVNAIWAAAPNDVWAVGDAISHWVNDTWVSPPKFPSNVVLSGPYVAVAGTGPSDVHFLLAGGYVVRADNQTLVEELSASTRAVALAPAAPRGVWALFDDTAGGVSRLYLLGASADAGWTAALAPAGLKGIWNAPDGTLWAAGRDAALLRRAPRP